MYALLDDVFSDYWSATRIRHHCTSHPRMTSHYRVMTDGEVQSRTRILLRHLKRINTHTHTQYKGFRLHTDRNVSRVPKKSTSSEYGNILKAPISDGNESSWRRTIFREMSYKWRKRELFPVEDGFISETATFIQVESFWIDLDLSCSRLTKLKMNSHIIKAWAQVFVMFIILTELWRNDHYLNRKQIIYISTYIMQLCKILLEPIAFHLGVLTSVKKWNSHSRTELDCVVHS